MMIQVNGAYTVSQYRANSKAMILKLNLKNDPRTKSN